MKIKTIILKISPEEKKEMRKARKETDKTWEDFFNRLVNQELANDIDKAQKGIN